MHLELLKAGQSLMSLEPATATTTMELIAIVAPTGKKAESTAPTLIIILRLYLQCVSCFHPTRDENICVFRATLPHVLCGT